jgi:hypothetical protein
MSYECDICGKTFANTSNLLRHKKVVHAYGTRNLGQQTLTVNGVTVMHHPFTCIVAGCTQSGKTVWVKSLLENAQTTISPTPQRIVWCYGQWQPSYFDMMRTMPGIEFNEGIVNAMYDAEQRMKEIMDAPQLSAVEKSKLYSDQLNRFLTFKNKMDVPAQAPVQTTPSVPAEMPQPNESVEIAPPVPATPKPNFLTPPPTEEERPKLKRIFSTIG